MDLPEVKGLIDTYYAAGKKREETVSIVSALPMNGDEMDAMEYIELIYKTQPLREFNLTDAGNGEAIAHIYGDTIRFVHEWKAWIIYRNGVWSLDTHGDIRRIAVDAMRRLMDESDTETDLAIRKKVALWYLTSEGDKKIAGALNMAACQPGITVTVDQLDTNPWLLNLKNGTYDLEKCELRPADPADLLTQQIQIDYNPDAYSDEWETNFLSTIFDGNEKLVDYIQRGIGFTLNGTQMERVFFFMYGLGRNGKSQLVDALRNVLGPYALECKPELFMESKYSGGGPDEGQAALKGVRLLSSTEIKRGQNLDVSLVKRMTGSEPMWHERKFQHGFSFKPTHTLWLSGNHEPHVKDTTDSIWDRLNKIPFDVRISSENEIKSYGQYLATEHGEAILNWCIRGAIAWKERALTDPPECVLAANADYRARQDVLHDFLEIAIVAEFGAKIPTTEMYNKYVDFCKLDEIDPIGKKSFNEAMRERGYRDKRGNYNKNEWQNVTFVTNVTDLQKDSSRARVVETLPKTGNKDNINNTLPVCQACGGENWRYLSDGETMKCKKCGAELYV